MAASAALRSDAYRRASSFAAAGDSCPRPTSGTAAGTPPSAAASARTAAGPAGSAGSSPGGTAGGDEGVTEVPDAEPDGVAGAQPDVGEGERPGRLPVRVEPGPGPPGPVRGAGAVVEVGGHGGVGDRRRGRVAAAGRRHVREDHDGDRVDGDPGASACPGS